MTVRMRHTKGHTRNRRSHHSLEKPALTVDKDGVAHLRHRASSVTGKYKGQQVINVEKKASKKAEKIKETKSETPKVEETK